MEEYKQLDLPLYVPVQLEFSKEAYDQFKELREIDGSPTRAGTILNALRVLNFVARIQAEGYEVRAVKEEGFFFKKLKVQTLPDLKTL